MRPVTCARAERLAAVGLELDEEAGEGVGETLSWGRAGRQTPGTLEFAELASGNAGIVTTDASRQFGSPVSTHPAQSRAE